MQTGSCTIEGQIFHIESRDIRGNKTLVTFHISDLTDSIAAKVFLSEDQSGDFLGNVNNELLCKSSWRCDL